MQIIKQIKQLGDHAKWSWQEASCDPNGQSSFLPFAGIFLVFVGGCMFIYGGFTKWADLVSNSVIMASLGASILLGKKIMNTIQKPEDVLIDDNNKVVPTNIVPDVPENG